VRLLVDSCVADSVVRLLRETGFDTEWVVEWLRDPGDREILRQAVETTYVVGGTITQVDGSSAIPFSEDEIAEFIATHDKTKRQISN
jgi:hypothetical protein